MFTLIIANIVVRVRVRPAQRRKIVDWSAFREPAYVLFGAASFLTFVGLYYPFFYIQLYALDKRLMKEDLAFYLLSILNAASTFGRLLPSILADYVGPLNIIIPCATLSGILTLSLIEMHSTVGIILIALLYEFFSGSFASLPPTVFVALSPNRGIVGTRMGMGFTIILIAVLIGTPIGGTILKAYDFNAIWAFGGTICVVGGMVMALARLFHTGPKFIIKA